MLFIDACFQKPITETPIWIMRQAGRYLKSYQQIRAQAGSFLNLCKNPDLAAEVTLQPMAQFDLDAAIIFSDILVVPEAMGMELDFIEGQGPVFTQALENESSIMKLESNIGDKLDFVYEAIAKTRASLHKDKALIGFCGSPFTIASYMLEGHGSKQFLCTRKLLYSNPLVFKTLLGKLTQVLILYLEQQIKAGANVLQIFDSWGGILPEKHFYEFSLHFMQIIAEKIKIQYPHIPIIIFAKGVGMYLANMKDKLNNFDVIGIDHNTPIQHARAIFKDTKSLQGNLDPAVLYSKEAIQVGVKQIFDDLNGTQNYIFNLGHGILKDIPPAHLSFLIKQVRKQAKKYSEKV